MCVCTSIAGVIRVPPSPAKRAPSGAGNERKPWLAPCQGPAVRRDKPLTISIQRLRPRRRPEDHRQGVDGAPDRSRRSVEVGPARSAPRDGGPVEIEAQLASTSRSRRLMSSMAAQLTGGTKVPDEGWP